VSDRPGGTADASVGQLGLPIEPPANGAAHGRSHEQEPYREAPPEIVSAMGGRTPTVQQWQAISHDLTPGVVVAGAGSGKTAVMAARVVYLAMVRTGRLRSDAHDGALPSEVLCLTFTNKAAEELARRVRTAVSALDLPEGEEPTVRTYHAFAAQLLDEYGLRMGMEPGTMLLTEAQKWQLIASLLTEREFDAWEVRSDYIIGQALLLSDQIANHLRTPEEVVSATQRFAQSAEFKKERDPKVREAIPKREELAGLVEAYAEAKKVRGAIDYGDQIAHACHLVEEHPEVAGEFRRRFPVVLLDEYQDTNHAQARLLSALCGRGYPVLAVGDPDQNIYAWRGASLQNILRFERDFGDPHGTRRPLYVNFRSGSRILQVAQEIIGKVPPERRGEDKELWPHPGRGTGRVLTFVETDERAEAHRIASLIKEQVSGGEVRWQDVAILCRKKRLFDPIAEVLRDEDVPVEVVDLAGLLKMPEVVDVMAWLRVLDDPARNVHLARILQGPRWRIGYRDLRALAAWSARRNRELEGRLPGDEDMPGDVAFALTEAIDHLDDPDMAGLSDEARRRLRDFAEVLAALRESAKGSLADLVEEIVERTGLWAELEASTADAAVGARRNILNLIQHISAFSPIEGEASLSTLVSYLDTAEETEDELEPAQPSEADTVKLLTIHKAKGLEWKLVFVPGMADNCGKFRSAIFPDVSRQPNPLTQPATMPFDLRGDADVLPPYGGDLKDFKKRLKERGLEEERRLCYVALTRARDVLVVSAAYWYSGPSEPFEPSTFYREVAAHPAAEELEVAECPEDNPLLAIRRERASGWPRDARPDDRDEVFPQGWHAAAVHAARAPASVEEHVASLSSAEHVAYRERLEADLERARLIEERTRPTISPPVPTTLSVTGVMAYAKCPKLFYWSQVRPLPRRPSQAARLGSEVHRWIELRSRGQATLIDVDDAPDLSAEEHLGDPPKDVALKDAFRRSRFAQRVPLYTERPFLLYLDGMVVGGRIDAIFEEPNGRWQVVDYKTGRVPAEADPITGLQLDLYALACVEVFGKRPEDLTLTYFYLGEEKEVSREAGDPAATRRRVLAWLGGIASGQFEARPGEQCAWCDFLTFCEPGRQFLAGEGRPERR
jgi:DNA helicase-2/ATP-dependent DNA helicase PcrA